MRYSSRIHLLGVGNIGQFVAHSLRNKHPHLKISLLLHRPELAHDWAASGRAIKCLSNGTLDIQSNFDIEIISRSTSRKECSQASERPIDYMVVATKAHVAPSALAMVKHRLQKSSSVLFLQNGIGTVDEVSASIFTDANSRPSLFAGICNCSVYRTSPFSIVHAGRGSIEFGPILGGYYEPFSRSSTCPAVQNPLIRALLETPKLEASLVTPDHIREVQLRKVIVNAVLNPLTTIFRCKMGELLDHPRRLVLMRALFDEVADIVRAILPQSACHTRDSIFGHNNLWSHVLKITQCARDSTTSMHHDVESGRKTEIEYINGYLSLQAQRFGLSCTNNNTIIDMVKRQQVITDDDIEFTFQIP